MDADDRKLQRSLDTIGWGLKRIAWVLESMVKGDDVSRSDHPCQRCGSFLLGGENGTKCAVCDLETYKAPEPPTPAPVVANVPIGGFVTRPPR